jgi:hypothetical protein
VGPTLDWDLRFGAALPGFWPECGLASMFDVYLPGLKGYLPGLSGYLPGLWAISQGCGAISQDRGAVSQSLVVVDPLALEPTPLALEPSLSALEPNPSTLTASRVSRKQIMFPACLRDPRTTEKVLPG